MNVLSRFGSSVIIALSGALRLAGGSARVPLHAVDTTHLLVSLIAKGTVGVAVPLPQVRELRREVGQQHKGSVNPAETPWTEWPSSSAADLEINGALREAAFMVLGIRGAAGNSTDAAGVWRDDVRVAVESALLRATGNGVSPVGRRYLLEGVLGDQRGRVQQILWRYHIDRMELLEAARAQKSTSDREPHAPLYYVLRGYGLVPDGRSVPASITDRAFTSLYVRFALRGRRPQKVMLALEAEAIRQAVRLGQAQVTTGHLLLAALQLDEQMAMAGRPLSSLAMPANDAGTVLAQHGITWQSLALLMAQGESIESQVASPTSRRPWRTGMRRPVWSATAVEAAENAWMRGHGQRREAGSGDLLAAALASANSDARYFLRGLGVDPTAVAREVVPGSQQDRGMS